eukprot:TRINITY_DN2085_c0_g1_i2.p1 TRINITY_DN2085_c0_g1~~TRINITY_DN2085_c0_g1_i2.p1  ORF type:complete len:242 (-),score=53.37 TRINITY_DN2085_c0_g1_i2:63-788(-)
MKHQGIKIEFIGLIEMLYDRNASTEFTSLVTQLSPAGVLSESQNFDFSFINPEKQNDSYNGANVRLRYFLRVTVARSGLSANISKVQDLWVENHQLEPEINNAVQMEVGIEDSLHIEFEYTKSKYHLQDVIIGKVYFLIVGLRMKHMEIALLKVETAGSGQHEYTESTTLTKYEIMDGAPVKGESIPIRMFLGGHDLTPTYRSINNKFSLKYYLNIVLFDMDEKRYYKQQEIHFWRKNIKN